MYKLTLIVLSPILILQSEPHEEIFHIKMTPELPPALEGFDAVPRRWNAQFSRYMANVLPGDFYVTNNDELIATTLGSCISVCVRDGKKGIGGLNHFMLPPSDADDGSTVNNVAFGKSGDWAMEFLINGILLNGGERRNLEVKVFGGAQLVPGLEGASIGKRNIKFIQTYLEREGLKVLSSDVGGDPPRKIIYNPKTGSVKLKRLSIANSRDIVEEEKKYGGELVTHNAHAGEIDLF